MRQHDKDACCQMGTVHKRGLALEQRLKRSCIMHASRASSVDDSMMALHGSTQCNSICDISLNYLCN